MTDDLDDKKYEKPDGSIDWDAYVADHKEELEKSLQERAQRVRDGTWKPY